MSHKSHAFTRPLFGWKYCAKCGLLTLKNEATRKAMNAPCRGDEKQAGGHGREVKHERH